MFETLSALLEDIIINLRNTTTWRDVVDVLLMTVIIYGTISLVKQTRALQLLKGVVIFLAGYFLAVQFNLKAVTFLMENILQIAFIALIIVFQPELRRAIDQLSRGKFSLSFFMGRSHSEMYTIWNNSIEELADSVEAMSRKKTGALIVVQRVTQLGDIVETGTVINADCTQSIIETIFYDGSPLHDGAVVIEDGKVKAAGCLLPLTSTSDIGKDMGTRHRAAIGMSEDSDAVVIVVSEETGIVSLAKSGMIIRRLDKESLLKILISDIIPPEVEKKPSRFFGRKQK